MSAAPIGREAGAIALATRRTHAIALSRVEMDEAFHRRCLAEHPKLIVVLTHGGMISFVPVAAALLRSAAAHDPARRIVTTMHQGWWRVPLLRRLPPFLTGADRPYTYPELQRALIEQPQLDYFALPESETSLYGDPGEVKPFRFHGFIELSIRARAPMLLVAHRGTERWYRRVDASGRIARLLARLPDRAYHWVDFNKKNVLGEIAARRFVNVPLPLGRVRLGVALELHRPELFERGLPDEWKPRRREVLAEGERIRARLQRLYDALDP